MILFIAGVGALFGDTTNAESILQKSFDQADAMQSKVTKEVDIIDGQEFHFTKYLKTGPDGFEYSRLETDLYNKGSVIHEISLHREDGDWMLYPWGAVHLGYVDDLFANLEKAPMAGANKYQISEVSAGTPPRPCYKITVTLGDGSYRNLLAIVQRFFSDKAALFPAAQRADIPKAEAWTPSRYEYVVDKATKQIWGERIYSEQGSVLRDHNYVYIEYNAKVSDDLLNIPATLNQFAAHSPMDFAAIVVGHSHQ